MAARTHEHGCVSGAARMLLVPLLLLLAADAHAGPPSPQPPFNVSAANIRGDTLVLDVGSLRYQGNHPMFPVHDRSGCAAACLRTPGCSAWTYCESKAGCGSGCSSYVQRNPQLRTAADANPTLPNPAWRSLPTITGFGPWGVTSSCKHECDASGSCKPGDKFPYGMCSLKRLADPSKPAFWSTDAAEGWVSGFWTPPPECKDVPGRACTRCAASSDPKSCLKCAANPALRPDSILDAALDPALTRADGCAACVDASPAPAQAARCVACLESGAECAACALQAREGAASAPAAGANRSTSGATDVPSCIDCMAQTGGGRFRDACLQCAALGAAPAQLSRCMSCLQRMRPLACDSTDYQPGCWNPAMQPGVCAACASSAANFTSCMSCISASPFSDSCGACAALPGAERQRQCYACSSAAKLPGSGCADCLAGSAFSDAAQQQQCVACLSNQSIPAEARAWCVGCQSWCADSSSRAGCEACLGASRRGEAYMSNCACKS